MNLTGTEQRNDTQELKWLKVNLGGAERWEEIEYPRRLEVNLTGTRKDI